MFNLYCIQCQFSWESKKENPIHCRNCKSRNWNKNVKYYNCVCGKSIPITGKGLHNGKCKVWQDEAECDRMILTKDFLITKLINENKSALSLANELNSNYIDPWFIIKKAKSLGIKTKTLKESANSSMVREKYIKTCLNKFGKENALSSGTDPYIKRNKFIKDKYGVDNIFQIDSVKEKIKIFYLNKYWVESGNQVPEIKNKAVETFIKKYGTHPSQYMVHHIKYITKPHLKIAEILQKYNIQFLNNTYTLRFKENVRIIPDIYIPSFNLIIEIYGDYWHANPYFYKNTDIIKYPIGERFASEIWERDASRSEKIIKNGFELLIFWENDINKSIDTVEEKICQTLKLNQLKGLKPERDMI